MTADLITYLNTRLVPLVENLPIEVRQVGLVRTVERTENKKTQRFPMPVDETDTQPVLPDSRRGLLLYWEQRNPTRVAQQKETRTLFRAGVRLIAWYDSRRIVRDQGGVKTLLVRHLLHYLTGVYSQLPDGVQALTLRPEQIVETRNELFGQYTFDNNAAQYMTHPYDAVGVEMVLEFWLNHGCIPELYAGIANACP